MPLTNSHLLDHVSVNETSQSHSDAPSNCASLSTLSATFDVCLDVHLSQQAAKDHGEENLSRRETKVFD